MVTHVVIADDHQLVRAGIVALLNDIPDVEVVGEASDGEQVIEIVARMKPDILFLDLSMPKMSGLETLMHIHKTACQINVIVLTMHDSHEYVHRALQYGAVGYMLKDALPDELESAIRAVEKGNRWLSSAISKTVIDGYLGRDANKEPLPALTERQNQILKMIAQGRSTKQIGNELNLSVKTIETYRTQIMNRLDIHDIAGLVRYAIRHGIVPL